MRKVLTRDEILQAVDLPTEVVPVPEWQKDGTVLVRGLTAEEKEKFEDELIMGAKGANLEENIAVTIAKQGVIHTREKLVVLGTVGEDGKPLFTFADVLALSKKSSAPITRIASVIQRLSGMDRKSVEKLEKNSGSQGGDSLSD